MIGLTILFATLFVGFYAPKPPGILGTMMEYYWFGGKEKEQKEIAKWRKLNHIDRELKKRGSSLAHEIIKKRHQ